jgi:hypothetical protein
MESLFTLIARLCLLSRSMNVVGSRLLWTYLSFGDSVEPQGKKGDDSISAKLTEFYSAFSIKFLPPQPQPSPTWLVAVNMPGLRRHRKVITSMDTILEDVTYRLQPRQLLWNCDCSMQPMFARIEGFPPSRLTFLKFGLHHTDHFANLCQLLRYSSNTLLDLDLIFNFKARGHGHVQHISSCPNDPFEWQAADFDMSDIANLKSFQLSLSLEDGTLLCDPEIDAFTDLIGCLPAGCHMTTIVDKTDLGDSAWKKRSDVYLGRPGPCSKKRLSTRQSGGKEGTQRRDVE